MRDTREELLEAQLFNANQQIKTLTAERDTYKQALEDLGVTSAEAKPGYLLLEEALFFVCGEDNALATKIEQFLSKHKVQGETKSCV